MSVALSQLGLHGEIDRFWQGVDQRTETGTGVDEAHTDTPTFAWGIFGTPLALPQPHYRIFVPTPYYIVGWGLLADAPGSAVVMVEHAKFNPGNPPVFTSVTGGADPTLASQQAVLTRRLTTWSPLHWGVYDMLHVYIFSTVGLQELTFQLFARRTPRVGINGNVSSSGGTPIVTSTGTAVVLATP